MTEHEKDSEWCLIGNIVDRRRYGEGGSEIKPGTKHFSGGTKIYCLPAQWGDGYNQVVVIGRHRGSKKYTTMIISSEWVTNLRAKVVYSPEVLRRIRTASFTSFDKEPLPYKWESKEQIERHITLLNKING